jgi:protein dithiol:quinone oxidoreductase
MTKTSGFIKSKRAANLAGFLACAAMLGVGYYLQFSVGLEPCPLCIMQRVGIFATGIGFLVAGLHNQGRTGARVYGVTIAIIAVIGGAISARHVWLQHTPEDQRPACGPGLNYLFENFAPLDALRKVLHGSGECGVVDWTFLGYSIPEMTLAAFAILIAWALYTGFRAQR